ncbi:Protein kinase domain protein [Planctomycetes bacterium MalM25]|nr:Protein kinase domain protein [Planctomycetes bacterium MalM25]
MTRPSSSLLRQPLDKPLLYDASDQVVPLGEAIGAGGEGTVFDIDGAPKLVAKVYHKAKLTEQQDRKLRKLTTLGTSDMMAIAAWPQALMYDPRTKAVRGLIMPKIADAFPLHELYGTTTRARRFPHAQWGHLVLAARNLAAAFGTMHEHGVVVGDVNQGNLLVDANMCVRMIDCDSFQVTHRKQVFRCPVGTPHFTPPELQSRKLIEVTRTLDHDGFGLAILIFHLLFVGRHPFAGRYQGSGDMTIEKAIAERRFAFSRNTKETLVEPPPASLRLEDLPASLGDLFERALRADGDAPSRPVPAEWVEQLEALIKNRKVCPVEEAHVHSSATLTCPWCAIENAGGPTFFLNVIMSDGSSEARLEALNAQLEKIEAIHYPELPAASLKLPKLPLAMKKEEKAPLGAADYLAGGWIGSAALCLGGAFYWPVLAAGAVGSLATAGALAIGKAGSERRRVLEERDAKLNEGLHKLAAEARQIAAVHGKRQEEYDAYAASVSTGIGRYQADTEDMDTILRQLRIEQKEDYLRSYSIRDYRRRIPGLTPQMVAVLQSFNIDSAYHVEKSLLTGVPGLSPSVMMELQGWRSRIEEKFEYKAEEGTSERELNADRQEATRRFKLALGRKILSGAKKMRAMAFAAQGQLDQALSKYKRHVESWRALAHERQQGQAARSPWESKLNTNKWIVLAAGVGAPLIGGLGWLLFS